MKKVTKQLALNHSKIQQLFVWVLIVVIQVTSMAAFVPPAVAEEALPPVEDLISLEGLTVNEATSSGQAEIPELKVVTETENIKESFTAIQDTFKTSLFDKVPSQLQHPTVVQKLPKKTYQFKDKVVFSVFYPEKKGFRVRVTNPQGKDMQTQITETPVSEDEVRVTLSAPVTITPGKYSLEVLDGEHVISTQDFTWGVLAINPNKSVYLFNETATFAIAVLDEQGEMVCDADVTLTITDPLGKRSSLTTENKDIITNPVCTQKVFTMTPDYEAAYTLGDVPGNYTLTLVATTKSGEYRITDMFEVREHVDFDIERSSPTRLYPPLTYPVELSIQSHTDFSGRITEVVPEHFDIVPATSSAALPYEKIEVVTRSEVSAEKVLGAYALHLPFKGERTVSLGFGQDLLDEGLRSTYKEFGIIAHDGVDFEMPTGTEIYPTDKGEVVLAEENSDYGTTIVIQHEWGKSYYGHLSELKVEKGQSVTTDTVIGLSGSTGLSTGEHLHFGTKLNQHDKYNGFFGKINPAQLLGLDSDGEVLGESADPRVKVKVITWKVDIKRGQKITLGYQFKAPEESPQFYNTGPLRFFDTESNLVFEETRRWQLAVDASIDPVVGFFSPPAILGASTTTTLNLAQPDPRNGDLMIAALAIRPAASTINTPSGWTLLDSRTGTDGGAEGADTGSVGLYWFYKVSDGTEGVANQAFTATGTPSVWTGDIMKARSATGTYDVAAAGYSISGDATNWNGTLDSDIGLKSGDLVLLSAAQNGDVSGVSAQNISATNVNVRSTAVEHGEYANTGGNDVELDIATSQIWEGNNTTTPTVTTTMSVANSGAVTAVRIRQGAGTNRTDTWVRAAGRQVPGTTSVALSYPEHDIGDVFVLFVGSRGSTDPTINTPAGWTSLGTYNGGAGAWAADAGNSRVAAFYREIPSRVLSGTQTVSVTNGLVSIGQILTVHKDDVGSWSIDSDGGSDNSAGTGWSVTGSGIDLSSSNGGDILFALSSINTDGQTYSAHNMSATGMTFGDVTQTAYFSSTTSNDMAIEAATGRITGGSDSTVAPTFTSTASGSTANSPAGSTLFVKIKGNNLSPSTSHMGYFSSERVWSGSTTTTLNLRQPDPRNNDLMVAVLAIRPASATINTPSGWTLLDSRTGTDGGAEGADTGSVGMYWFYKVSDGTEGTTNQAFTATGTPSVWTGSILQVRSATGTYSLSAGGYSINGDTTNWSNTLDTDIGLTQGDIVLIGAAQNGDLSNTSAWDVAATGITSKGTANEDGEFANTGGNDIEVDLAGGQIFEGTNSATPSITLTQSAASSGVVAAVRVRQGAGTNRTDTWVRSAGSQVIGTTSLAVPYPIHEVGDLFVLFVGNRDSTDSTPNTPDGWTSLGTFVGGAGVFGADAGNARITAYYQEVTSRRFGTQTVTIDVSNTSTAQMISVHRDDVTSWTLDSDGGTDTTNGTAWSVTGSGIDLDSADGGDILLVGSSMNTDAALYSSQALSASGITFGDVTETSEYRSPTGNDMTLEIANGRVSGGSANGVAPTYTATASTSGGSSPTGGSLFVKIHGNLTVINDTPELEQTMRHGKWFDLTGVFRPFTF